MNATSVETQPRSDYLSTIRFAKLSRFGVWVAEVCLLAILLRLTFKIFGSFQRSLLIGASSVFACGVILLLLRPKSYLVKPTPERVLQFHGNPHYWGSCLIAVAGLVLYLGNEPIEANPPPPPPPPPVAVEPSPPPAKVFPELEISAVIVNGEHSAATINGSYVALGESICGVKLALVTLTNVVVEMDGEQRELLVFEGD